MKKLVLYVKRDSILVQRAEYIDNGWFIEIVGSKNQLYEIPDGGGKPIFIGEYETLMEAICRGETLT